MPKTFYTESDIIDFHNQGKTHLEVTDDVVLTELAYEKAKKLGFQLAHQNDAQPPSAPVRPYLTQEKPAVSPPHKTAEITPNSSTADLRQRVHNAVAQKMGNQIDPGLLDKIIDRVLSNL